MSRVRWVLQNNYPYDNSFVGHDDLAEGWNVCLKHLAYLLEYPLQSTTGIIEGESVVGECDSRAVGPVLSHE